MVIVFKEFKERVINGRVKLLVVGTELQVRDDVVVSLDGKPITYLYSDSYCKYFANNDDGKGLERGNLRHLILYSQRERPSCHYIGDRRFSIDETKNLQQNWSKYLIPHAHNVLVFNEDFYDAPVEDLRSIAEMLNMLEVRPNDDKSNKST